MKRLRAPILIVALCLAAYALLDIRPIFYANGPTISATEKECFDRDKFEATLNRIDQNIPEQTAFYPEFEFINLTTHDQSLVLMMKSIEPLSNQNSIEVLNGRTVKIIRRVNKYSYKYRVAPQGNGAEESGSGAFTLKQGDEETIQIGTISLAFEARSKRSLWVSHPSNAKAFVTDKNRYEIWPLGASAIGSNKAQNADN